MPAARKGAEPEVGERAVLTEGHDRQRVGREPVHHALTSGARPWLADC